MTDISLGLTSTVGSYVFAGAKPERNASVVNQASVKAINLCSYLMIRNSFLRKD